MTNQFISKTIEFALEQLDSFWNPAAFSACLRGVDADKVKRVIITGSDYGYSAAGAVMAGFKKLSGCLCNSPDLVDFCRFYTEEKVQRGSARDEVLLITVDSGDHSMLLFEAREKAEKLGISRKSITAEGANDAERYLSCLIQLISTAAALGLFSGRLTEEDLTGVKEDLITSFKNFLSAENPVLEKAQIMEQLTHNLQHFEVIADWNEAYSAQFIEQYLIRHLGVFCDHVNSEEYVHLSAFYRAPSEIAMVVLCNKIDTSMSRMKATVYGCLAQNRPTLIVTDEEPVVFEASFSADIDIQLYDMHIKFKGDNLKAAKPTVCSVPTPMRPWMSVFTDFIPAVLMAELRKEAAL